MINAKRAVAACSMLILAGCQSTPRLLDAGQPAAMQAALGHAQSAMKCPSATGELLSRQRNPPFVVAPYNGVERAAYVVGVSGCGQRQIYVAICEIGSVSCVTAKRAA
jgi:hypothetical protein